MERWCPQLCRPVWQHWIRDAVFAGVLELPGFAQDPAQYLVETANTIGLPRYAKQAVDQQFARWVMLHVQSNPLPICTRPRVLIKGKRT
jgi:hypothetical protein